MKYVSIAGIFRECVESVSEKLLPQLKRENSLITGVHFRHGTWIEIKTTLAELGGGRTTPATKWPMVGLFHDFTEERGVQGFYSRPRLNLVIATANPEPNMKSDEREERYFKPILYPIYFELLNAMYLHPQLSILDPTLIPHTAVDHYHYSTQQGQGDNPGVNIFNEHVDSIEIRDLETSIKPLNC